MTIFSGLFALFGQLLGGVATATVGWAVSLLFGRVPQSRRAMLAGIGLGSLIWLTALLAIAIPALGHALVSAFPSLPLIGGGWLAGALVAIALLLPLGIGISTLALVPGDARPTGFEAIAQILRGYPYALAVGLTIVFLALFRFVRKVRSLERGWQSDHLAFIVKEGSYDVVADDLEKALQEAGLRVERRRAPRVVEVPPRIIALAGGPAARGMIPNELVEFDLDQLGIILYPSDVALLGRAELVARARAVIARRITFTEAYLTMARESQQIEDHLAAIARAPFPDPGELAAVDVLLASLVVPYADWQTLYRLRLQVEAEHPAHGGPAPVPTAMPVMTAPQALTPLATGEARPAG